MWHEQGECCSGILNNRQICMGLDGKDPNLPNPGFGTTLHQWVASCALPDLRDVWATIEGNLIQGHVPLPQHPFVLRLRLRVRGGTKKHNTNDVNKLRQHLLTKGVAESDVQGRIDAVLQHINAEQLAGAYKSLEPWASMKQLLGGKVRLVTVQEMKIAKNKVKPPQWAQDPRGADHEDPWVHPMDGGKTAPEQGGRGHPTLAAILHEGGR